MKKKKGLWNVYSIALMISIVFAMFALILASSALKADTLEQVLKYGKPRVVASIGIGSDGSFLNLTKTAWPKLQDATSFTVTSATATAINITYTAGVDGPCMVCLSSISGTETEFVYWPELPDDWDGITAPTTGDIGAVDANQQCFTASSGNMLYTIAKDTGDVIISMKTYSIERQ